MKNAIYLWHGAQRWDGWVEIVPSRPGAHECGPGFYMTNSVSRASSYAKGAGGLVRVGLQIPRLTSEIFVPRQEIADFVARSTALRNRAPLLSDITHGVRPGQDLSAPLRLDYFVNLIVNHDAIIGRRAPDLVKWLVDRGAQATLEKIRADEEWMVLLDPRLVTSCERVSRSTNPSSFDKPSEQIANILSNAAAQTAEDPYSLVKPGC